MDPNLNAFVFYIYIAVVIIEQELHSNNFGGFSLKYYILFSGSYVELLYK